MKRIKPLNILEWNKDSPKQYILKSAFLSKKIKLEFGEIPLNYNSYELIA